jgi:GntR family transcriptional regulator
MPTMHDRIVQDLRTQINDGRLAPGAPVPSSRMLADQWECARVTASDALKALAREGLIINRKGVGFFVTDTPVARPAGRRAAGTARTEGALPFKIVGRPDYRLPPDHVARALGIAEGIDALARTRLLYQPSGEQVTVVTSWFQRTIAERCELLRGTAPIPGGTTRHIIARTGLRPVAGRDVRTVRLADEHERTALSLSEQTAVEAVLHTAWTSDGFVLVAEEGVTPGRFVEHIDEYLMES